MQKILVLAALPDRLRLDKEIREIEEAIKRAVKRDSFEIKIRTAVRTQDIRRALAEERPQIVHFCGHGLEDGSLLLEDEVGNHNPVSPRGLVSLFRLHAKLVKCVLLNACYSSRAAEAISQHVNYVIGMNQPIQDRAAIVFAQGFYDGLGYDDIDKLDVIQRAFNEGIVAIQLENLSQEQIPVLWKWGILQRKSEQPEKVSPVNQNNLNRQVPIQTSALEHQQIIFRSISHYNINICPQCNSENPNTYKFCQNCGTSLIEKVCSKCSNNVALDVEYCDNCGNESGTVWWAILTKEEMERWGTGYIHDNIRCFLFFPSFKRGLLRSKKALPATGAATRFKESSP